MSKSQQSFNKKEKEKKKAKKREEKLKKREERKANNSKGAGLDSMIQYVDEYGFATDEAPVKDKSIEIDPTSIVLDNSRADKGSGPAIRTGRVSFFDHSKGFGFIKENGSPNEYFVHVNGCIDEIKEGDTVTYDLERGPKGMNAVKVKKV